MKKINNRAGVLFCTALVFVVYSVIALLYADLEKLNVWAGYLFVAFSFVFSGATAFVVCKDPFDAKAVFYSEPVLLVSYAYNAVAIVVNSIWMFFSSETLKHGIVINVILALGFIIAGTVLLLNTRKIKELNQDKDERVAEMREMTNLLLDIAAKTKNTELSAKIRRLAEDFRFSAPVVPEAVKKLDGDLYSRICELRNIVEFGSDEAADALVQSISAALKFRNREAKK